MEWDKNINNLNELETDILQPSKTSKETRYIIKANHIKTLINSIETPVSEVVHFDNYNVTVESSNREDDGNP